jgi:hypothetical protein
MPNSPKSRLWLGLALALAVASASAGPLDPDCTPEKAAKSAAAKATVGVGGRCDAKEAAHDTAGLGDKNKKDKKDNKDKKDDKEKKDKKDDKDADTTNGWSISK